MCFAFYPLLVHYLEDVRKLALTVGNVSGVSSAKGHDALLQVAERLVDVHALLLDSFVGNGAPFQSLLKPVVESKGGARLSFSSFRLFGVDT